MSAKQRLINLLTASQQKPNPQFIKNLEINLLGPKPHPLKTLLLWLSVPAIAIAAYMLVVLPAHTIPPLTNGEDAWQQLDQIENDLHTLDSSSFDFLNSVQENLAIKAS